MSILLINSEIEGVHVDEIKDKIKARVILLKITINNPWKSRNFIHAYIMKLYTDKRNDF